MSILANAINFPPNMMTLIVFKRSKTGAITIPLPLHFPINPESFMILKKYLFSITNTEGGGFIDDYGEAPHPMTLTGTFGYNTKGYGGTKLLSGFGWVKYLEWLVDQSHVATDNGKLPEVWLMSWLSQHFLKVELGDLNISQTVQRNTLWTYSLKLTALGNVHDKGIIGDAVLMAGAIMADNVINTIKDAGLIFI